MTHELFVLALSLVWFARATPDSCCCTHFELRMIANVMLLLEGFLWMWVSRPMHQLTQRPCLQKAHLFSSKMPRFQYGFELDKARVNTPKAVMGRCKPYLYTLHVL